ncbi:hypothetical protein GUJ93_ZPchr0008g11394 [Zizania palustris]|uniref:MAR-binding filament-like protein 1-1 n=1 Tax=Zizania palustris TaxID=103762 RepID=A0A8J5RAP1_ZIZPA|nr:hypothetical protein GUJ93_ZPchr0008g11394 [Zizania palustris]
MGYLLVSPSPPLAFRCQSSRGCLRRARRGAGAIVASSASPDDAGPSQAAAYIVERRAVLLGVSALPLLRARESAAAVASASSGGLVTETKDAPKPDEPQPGETQAQTPLPEASQPEPSLPVTQEQAPGNPFAGLLNAIAVIASGVLAGLYGTSQQEKKALQSVISSMENKLVENEAAISLMKENYEKRLLDQQATQKKQAMKFQEQEASLLDQLSSTKKTVTSLSEEFRREKTLAADLKDEIHRLESSIAQAREDKNVLEAKLKDKLDDVNVLQEKVSLLGQEIDNKDIRIRELSSLLSSKEADYQNLCSFSDQTKESLDLAEAKIQQLQEDVHRTRNDLASKISSIDLLNEKLQALDSAKNEAEAKLSALIKDYTDLKASSETRESHDSKLVLEKDNMIKQLGEKLSVALSNSSKDCENISVLNKELDATKALLENEAAAVKSLRDSLQSTEEALIDSRSQVAKFSEELDEANRMNQGMVLQMSKLQDEFNEMQEGLTNNLQEVESVSKALSDEMVSVKEMVHKGREEFEATSSELASVVEARDNLKKELLDVYKKLESTSQELVDERKTVATLNRELEALVKQLQVDSEARKALEADLDEATKSLDEMNRSALSLSKELEDTNSRNDILETEKEMMSKALAEQKKITTEAHENTEDAQNLISRLQTERESFEMRSRHLEEELALAKGEILRIRRQISTSRSQRTKTLPRTNASPEISQAPNEHPVNDDQKTSKIAAGSPHTAKRTTRRRKGGEST